MASCGHRSVVTAIRGTSGLCSCSCYTEPCVERPQLSRRGNCGSRRVSDLLLQFENYAFIGIGNGGVLSVLLQCCNV